MEFITKAKDLMELEKKYGIHIKVINESKYGFKGEVSKVEIRTTKSGHKFNTHNWLFTFDTHSKASFIRTVKEEMGGER